MKLINASNVLPWILLSSSRPGYAAAGADDGDDIAALTECITKAVNGDNDKVRFGDEPGYLTNDLKPFNLNLQWKPFAITYPDTSEEVAAVVSCASDAGRKVQARSGGRDFVNKCIGGSDGYVIVDMKNFKTVQVDPQTNIASIGPGNLLPDLVNGLHTNGGRFIPHGSSPTVGVGGHFMVGGMGYTSREHKLAIDTIREVEVVLANGTIARAAEDENPDLLWAMKGAGASFGIATEFKVQTEEEPAEVVGFTYSWESPSSDNDGDPSVLLGNALKRYYDMVRDEDLSLKLGGTLRFTNTSLVFSGGFFGTKAEFDEEVDLGNRLAPTTTTAVIEPGLSWIDFMTGLLESGGSTNNPAHFTTEDTLFARPTIPTNETLDQFLDHIYNADSDGATWSFLFDLYGGAMDDVKSDATAFPHRDALVALTAYARSPDETSETTVKFMEEAVLKLQNGEPERYGSYAGVPSLGYSKGEEGKAQRKYWGDNLERLERVKAVYDPEDVFSTPQGVKPAAGRVLNSFFCLVGGK